MDKKTGSWFLLFLLALIWGSSFILMKKAMVGDNHVLLLTANQVASLRIVFAAVVISPIFFLNLSVAFSKKTIWFVLVGLLGNLIPAFLFTNAEKHLSSSFTGILNSLVPIFSLLVGYFVFKASTNWKGILGVFIGFIGAVLLIAFREKELSSDSDYAILMVVGATICYAFSLNIIKYKLEEISSIKITGISLFFVLPLAGLFYGIHPISSFTNEIYTALGYTAILAIVGTTFALIVFNTLIKLSSSVFASSVTYLIPFVAIMWGIFFKEKISWSVIFIFVVISGIYLVKQGDKKK